LYPDISEGEFPQTLSKIGLNSVVVIITVVVVVVMIIILFPEVYELNLRPV
jgi:hypothetical protein